MGKIINFPKTKANIYADNLDTQEKIESKDITIDEFVGKLEDIFAGTDDNVDVIVFTIKSHNI